MKKISFLLLTVILMLSLSACGPFGNGIVNPSDALWTNDNAVIARIKESHANDVMNKLDSAFPLLDLEAVYVNQKYFADTYRTLDLRLVLKNSGKSHQDAAIDILQDDERVERAHYCNDVPFETINTLQIIPSSYTVIEGESITLKVEGDFKTYMPSFCFDEIIISMLDFDNKKEYTPADFPQFDISAVSRWDLSYITYFTLTLSTPGYYEAVKAVDAFSRDPNVETAWLNGIDYADVITPEYWGVSDATVADFEKEAVSYNHPDFGEVILYYDIVRGEDNSVTLNALQPGKVTITYAPGFNHGVSSTVEKFGTICEITVLSANETNLMEKYGLTVNAYIWNDYMPGVLACSDCTGDDYGYLDSEMTCTRCGKQYEQPKPVSLCYALVYTTADNMPVLDINVSACIVTQDKDISVLFKNVPGAGLRPTVNFRLDDGEMYDIYLTVEINGEYQIIHLQQTVDVTH